MIVCISKQPKFRQWNGSFISLNRVCLKGKTKKTTNNTENKAPRFSLSCIARVSCFIGLHDVEEHVLVSLIPFVHKLDSQSCCETSEVQHFCSSWTFFCRAYHGKKSHLRRLCFLFIVSYSRRKQNCTKVHAITCLTDILKIQDQDRTNILVFL